MIDFYAKKINLSCYKNNLFNTGCVNNVTVKL